MDFNLSDYFKRLGAPLVNTRWSWGAVREDGSVVLRVWQHDCKKINGIRYVHITEEASDDPHKNQGSAGYSERNDHVQLLKNGAEAYLVMCHAEDPDAKPRKIKGFNSREVFVAGNLLETDGDTWLEIRGRIPASSVSIAE